MFRLLPLWVFVITLAALAAHPIPECFDCEFPNAWGRNDNAYYISAYLLDAWFVIASAAAGFISVKRNWLVPLGITAAHLFTQPLGGVALWSLKANEGPLIVIVGLIAGMVCLVFGWLLRVAFNHLRRPAASPA
jgi:hypothetical protein